MSYDLMVFDPAFAPRDRTAFMAWYEKLVDWPDNDGPYDPATSSPVLQTWYKAMLPSWPNMQEVEDDEADSPRLTGYTFAPHAIYIDFRWSVAEEAYDETRRMAFEHRIGFYDVSGDEGDGEIHFPGDDLRPPSHGGWRKFAADFKSSPTAAYASLVEPPKRSWLDFFRRSK
jgi:hypothetical protein